MILRKFARWILLILVFSIPFGTRKFIFSFIDGIREFDALFLYGTHILLLVFLTLFLLLAAKNRFKFFNIKRIGNKNFLWLLLFVFLAGVSIFFAHILSLALFRFFEFLLLCGFVFGVFFFLRSKIVSLKAILSALAVSSIFQSIIAIFQFFNQGSLGLAFLGESALHVSMFGVAKTSARGLEFLRSYGTMSHANILAAFLILGILSVYYLYFKRNRFCFVSHLITAVGIFVLWLGLIFSFSRAGWIIAILVTLIVLVFGFLNKERRKRTIQLFFALVTSCLLLITVLGWLIFPRAGFVSTEPSVSYRVLFNKMAIEMIREKPLGVGIGNQTLFAINLNLYQEKGLTRIWEWQPVHNIYLLIASETGILGLSVFLVFVVSLFLKLKRFWSREYRNFLSLFFCLTMLFSLLLFGLVDHFTWALQSGKLMFGLVCGLCLASERFLS